MAPLQFETIVVSCFRVTSYGFMGFYYIYLLSFALVILAREFVAISLEIIKFFFSLFLLNYFLLFCFCIHGNGWWF